MQALLLHFLTFASSYISEDTYEHWNNHKQTYNLKYTIHEEFYRFSIFRNNLKHIQHHNKQNFTYKLGINKFAHLVKYK